MIQMRIRAFLLIATLLLTTVPVFAATATYTYDAAGRLTRVEYSGGKGFTYQYDNAGNLIARTALTTTAPPRRRAVRRASLDVEDLLQRVFVGVDEQASIDFDSGVRSQVKGVRLVLFRPDQLVSDFELPQESCD
jgi:YD repeat-containing protein